MIAIQPIVAQFHPPTTNDFVFDCWGGSLNLGGVPFCFNFIFFLVAISFSAFILLFFLAFRKPQVIPGKLQSIMESGVQFVRENISEPMMGKDGERFMPLFVTLFFFILLGNLLEVVPMVNFSANSRIAFPIAMALVSWLTFNIVGIRKHGFGGYMKHVLFPPGAPAWLYPLLVPIEFITQLIVRPITLSVRLAANFLAGHFLLAVFFLGTIAMIESGGITVIFGPFAFAIAVALVGFEIFVALLQAFIFTILTASYIGGAMAEEH